MDYTALDQSGMWSSNIDQLKAQNVTAAEVSQIAKLKQSGASDDLCCRAIQSRARSSP